MKIREFSEEHFSNLSLMIDFQYYFDAPRLSVEYLDAKFELFDSYCKRRDCDCSEVNFKVYKNGSEVGELSYDYLDKSYYESEYSFLLEDIFEENDISEQLRIRHALVKNEFEISKTKREIKILEKLKTLDNKIVGRNEKCPCGSGRKYKHCCLRK